MALTDYKYKKGDGIFHAISEGYKQADDYWGIPGAAGGFGEYAKNNKLKTTVVGGTFLAVALTNAYFLSPAYVAFVGTVGTKAATLVSPAITAVSAFLVAHPLVASLIVVAAVAALIAAPVYAYKSSSKANQIDAVKEIINKCEKDKDSGKVKVKDGDASTFLTKIGIVVGVVPALAKAQ
ncbi:hypothetical protein [Wolbachia endosymbiont (group A) of Sicus ferrugineus]|uniref:hypothetical protein n=1 Tax=Wolbachia endosymbiont (group A) of Sicus ferrugineus TaxID=2954056 RepID=UPI002231F12A|nr:hypothetical protein [Wolbachia endosymbiont (group A) of Sicus ferrugineus]